MKNSKPGGIIGKIRNYNLHLRITLYVLFWSSIFKLIFFETFLQERYKSFNRFKSRSEPNLSPNYWQRLQSLLVRKVLNQHWKSDFCLFDLILYVPSTIFQLYRDGSSWVEPVLS